MVRNLFVFLYLLRMSDKPKHVLLSLYYSHALQTFPYDGLILFLEFFPLNLNDERKVDYEKPNGCR